MADGISVTVGCGLGYYIMAEGEKKIIIVDCAKSFEKTAGIQTIVYKSPDIELAGHSQI